MYRSPSRAFTIIELLVVVFIIGLLMSLMLPAIGKARDQALLTQSKSNLRQLGTAAAAYAAEWNDRQLTYIDDHISSYGENFLEAMANYADANGTQHRWIYLGYARSAMWGYAPGPTPFSDTAPAAFVPVKMDAGFMFGFGAFRLPNTRHFNQYLCGRFYDPVFYAPKDTVVMRAAEEIFDHPDEYVPLPGYEQPANSCQPDALIPAIGGCLWSSYCFSPAAMFDPAVLSYNSATGGYYHSPWSIPGGFRSPTHSQARNPDLKTMMLEHHWLQGRKAESNANFSTGPYHGCQPYFFNHAVNSAPAAVFFDGHIGQIGQVQAMKATARVAQQSGRPNGGLWSIDTPMGGGPGGRYPDGSGEPTGGYFQAFGFDWTATSYHILTIDGIRGRDIVAQ